MFVSGKSMLLPIRRGVRQEEDDSSSTSMTSALSSSSSSRRLRFFSFVLSTAPSRAISSVRSIPTSARSRCSGKPLSNPQSTLYLQPACLTIIIMDAPTTASAHTHMGTPPPGYDEDWVTHTIHCHGFASLSAAEEGESVDSPDFMLLGNQWRMQIYPGGDTAAAEGMTSLFLYNKSNKAIEIDYGFSVNDGRGKRVAYKRSGATPRNFAPVGGDKDHWGSDLAERTTLMSSLVNGTLIIEFRMRLAKPTASVLPPFIPENPLTKMIQEEFLRENYSDIIFEVGGGQRKDNVKKVAKTTPVTFPAHRIIVAKFSNTLADLCESGAGDNGTNPIQIDNVSPDIFRLLLSYIYGMTISNDNMMLHTKEIIDAADRFGVTSLKLEAEASLVKPRYSA